MPGSAAATTGSIDPGSLGLEPTYGDCDCPRAFTISDDGTTIAWFVGSEVVVHVIDGGTHRSWTVPALAEVFVRSVDVRPHAEGGGFDVLLNVEPFGELAVPSAILATLAPDGRVEATPTGTRFASFPP